MKIFGLSIFTALILSAGCNSSQKTTAEANPTKKTTAKTHTEFIAMSNEPSWVVIVDLNSGIRFSSLDDNRFDIKTEKSEIRKPQDISATNYKGEFENGYIQVMVYHKSCTDDMSGEVYDNKVRVSVTNTEIDETVEYLGCGYYQGDYRLNDIWVLTEIDNQEVSMNGAIRPSLEFNISEKRLHGFGGCNQINGTFAFKKNQVVVGQLMHTLMACINQDVEDKFLKHLNGQTMDYEIGDNQLKMWNDTGSLTFKKGD
ncbi:META domain-containing protein [Owenweeksia hongkongensis]|uniref:META domain-containing protein n=1 Tax=Owenweeksia hongkongensis TaxID=253245 RepID=UPI003A92A7AD